MENSGSIESASFHYRDENHEKREKLSLPRHGTESEGDFGRLKKSILRGSQWQFSLIDCAREVDRCYWIERINSELKESELRIGELNLSAQIPDVSALMQHMVELSKDYDVFHVLNGTDWFNLPGRWEFFNLNRENFARECPARWLFWGGAPLIVSCVNRAADLWSWRAGIYCLAPNDDVGNSL
jgi:hypothetical protein